MLDTAYNNKTENTDSKFELMKDTHLHLTLMGWL